MTGRFDSILGTVGRTPVVRINRLAPDDVELYVKLEAFNPMGSVKDRMALAVIEEAERSGELQRGQTVIEATSGNTGIGLAMVCAAKGYPLVVVMAENFSVERRKLMRFLGAKVVLTPASEKGTGMLAKARELAAEHGWFLCRQFSNEANADAHSRTTAVEILDDFGDRPLDYWVTGFGTGGTLKGVARVLKERSPSTRVIVCEPDNSPMLASGVRQQQTDDGFPVGSHPRFRTHPIQGWAPDFIPKLADDAAALDLIDEVVAVRGSESLRLARELACREGIFTGISGGATLAGALQVCSRAPAGSRVLCMLPDTGERYLSTPLFADVPVEMSAEEEEISRSTPSYRFDVRPAACGASPPAAQPVSPEADDFVSGAIGDSSNPVVMFAFEYCEFCWSVRELFKRCEIPYRSIDLDSAEFQRDDWGGRVRAALGARVGSPTVPQIFVGGEHIGGCTETFDAFKDGAFQTLLEANRVPFDAGTVMDPYTLLPTWLHPR
jgi:cysteine synthase A